MEEKLGRPVNVGEVFVKTHTRSDGTFVDRKAEKIAQAYEMNLQEKLSEIQVEPSCVSDGTSRIQELTTADYTNIFLKSTEKNSRGIPYGVGSINVDDVVAGNKQGGSLAFVTLEEKLKEAQAKIDEQVSYNSRREQEHARVVDEHKKKLQRLSLVEEYLRQSDPAFLDFMAARSDEARSPLSPSPTTTPDSPPHAP